MISAEKLNLLPNRIQPTACHYLYHCSRHVDYHLRSFLQKLMLNHLEPQLRLIQQNLQPPELYRHQRYPLLSVSVRLRSISGSLCCISGCLGCICGRLSCVSSQTEQYLLQIARYQLSLTQHQPRTEPYRQLTQRYRLKCLFASAVVERHQLRFAQCLQSLGRHRLQAGCRIGSGLSGIGLRLCRISGG